MKAHNTDSNKKHAIAITEYRKLRDTNHTHTPIWQFQNMQPNNKR